MRPALRSLPALPVALGLGLGLAPALAPAQETTQPSPPPRAERLLGGWIGASVAGSTRWGTISDRRLFVAALRAQYLLETFGPLALSSTIDVVPLAVLSNTPEYRAWAWRQPDGVVVNVKTETGRSPVLGAGVVPAGLQLHTVAVRPARLFLAASAGVIWFTRDTPVPDARRLNIALDLGTGAEVPTRNGRAIVLGYRYQHLSNGGTARLNPGFDAHVVYMGLMRRRGARKNGNGEPTVAQ